MKAFFLYKKSILFSIGFLFFYGFCRAQIDTAEVRHLLNKQNYAHAKELVDSIVLRSPNPSNLLLKAEVYKTIADNPQASSLIADGYWAAYQAIEQSLKSDKAANPLKAKALAEGIYTNLLNDGILHYNNAAGRNSKEGFEASQTRFKKAATVYALLSANNWTTGSEDSLNITYLSLSSIYADKETDAEFYAKKIIDNKLQPSSFKSSIEVLYQWLLYHYAKANNEADFEKYLAAGRELYPQSGFYDLAELQWRKNKKEPFETLIPLYKVILARQAGQTDIELDYYKGLIETKGAVADKETMQLQKNLEGMLLNKPAADVSAAKARLLLAALYIKKAGAAKPESTPVKLIEKGNNYLLPVANNKQLPVSLRKEAAQNLVSNYTYLKNRAAAKHYNSLLKSLNSIAL